MANNNNNKNNNADKSGPSEETVLFLFLAFGILILLILILVLLGFQTYLSWRVAHALIDDDDDDDAGGERGFRRWERERKERKKALRALEKGRGVGSIRSWGYRSAGGGARLGRANEEVGMTGARGSSIMVTMDKFSLGDHHEKEKKPFWSIKRWM